MVKRVLLGFAAVCAAFVFVPFAPASGAPSVVGGPCQGTGDFEKSGHHYTAADTGVDKIPRTDDVHWAGSIAGPAAQSTYSGAIEVELPPGFGTLKIDSWSGTTDTTSSAGVKHYDIPSFVPANVEFKVKGVHTQGGIPCAGFVKLQIDGSVVNPFSAFSFLGTVLTGAGLAIAGRPKVGN